MKTLLFAIAILLFALPAGAQGRFGSSPAMTNNGGAGGVSGGGYGGGYGGGGGYGFGGYNALPHYATALNQVILVQGTDGDYFPSTFVSFDEAVKMGEEALSYKPKSLGEVAAEYRAAKKSAQ